MTVQSQASSLIGRQSVPSDMLGHRVYPALIRGHNKALHRFNFQSSYGVQRLGTYSSLFAADPTFTPNEYLLPVFPLYSQGPQAALIHICVANQLFSIGFSIDHHNGRGVKNKATVSKRLRTPQLALY